MKRGLTLLALAAAALALGAGSVRGAGETITVEDSTPWQTLDPQADPGFSNTLPIHFVTCEGLYAYPDAEGSAGMQAQPDVAAGPPTVSTDGLTYTFTVRSGLLFSNDTPVTAQSFVDAIHRLQNPSVVGQSGNDALASDIASATANGDQLTIGLSHTPTTSLLDRLAQFQFCPVPPGTPLDAVQPDTMPTDGPYYVADNSGGAWTISQNPNYEGSRIRNLGTIVWRYGIAQATAVADTLAGTADYAPDLTPNQTLDDGYGAASPAAAAGHQQYYLNSAPIVGVVVFNTRAGHPLADETTRREVACAIAADRTNYASQVGGLGAIPVDHFILPGFPGSADTDPCAGVGDPPSGLVLSGLFRKSGSQGPTAAGLLQSELGLKGVTLNSTFTGSFFGVVNSPPWSWDVTVVGFGPSNTDPGAYLTSLFGTGGDQNFGGFSDGTIDSDLAAAEAMPLGSARDDAFANVDAEIAAAAPMTAEYAFPRADLFSARIGCQVYQPLFGMNLNLLCVRVADTSVPAGGTVSTGTDATTDAPLQTGVTTPTGGSVSIQQGVTTTPTSGYSLLSQQLVITAPPATAADPLVLTFTLDASVLDGADPSTVDVFRDGAVIPDCTGSGASPDPCVSSRTPVSGGDVQIVVLTSHASTWNFALLGPAQYAAALAARIGALGLPKGTTDSLLAKVRAYEKAKGKAACGDLNALANEIRAQAKKQIPAATANELLADVAQLRSLSHC